MLQVSLGGARPLFLLVLLSGLAFSVQAQEPARRDAVAVSLLRSSVQVMGGSMPADSTATGKATRIAGSTIEEMRFRLTTRGLDQNAFHLEGERNWSLVQYRAGHGYEKDDSKIKRLPLEPTATAGVGFFPFQYIARALADISTTIEYVGTTELDSEPAHHLRLKEAFSRFKAEHLSEFSATDVLLDAATTLPRKIVYVRREDRYDPGMRIEVFFADYRNMGTVLYPFQIFVRRNGVLWLRAEVQHVGLNTGLRDTDFAAEGELQ